MERGHFFGNTGQVVSIPGITLTDTVYTHEKVDWHYHEQAYFTFLLQGGLVEGNKQEKYECIPGTLLFHNWQESHYNIKPPVFSRGFHLEIDTGLLLQLDIPALPSGSSEVKSPRVKSLVRQLFYEMKTGTSYSTMIGSAEMTVGWSAIQSLVVALLGEMYEEGQRHSGIVPMWVQKARQLLHDTDTRIFSLTEIAAIVGIHPVHFSRSFPVYFGCNLGEYQRMIRVEQSVKLLADPDQSLTSIAYGCGFADQSHFNRCFREFHGMGPKAWRSMLVK